MRTTTRILPIIIAVGLLVFIAYLLGFYVAFTYFSNEALGIVDYCIYALDEAIYSLNACNEQLMACMGG